jgi:hypothetical protein
LSRVIIDSRIFNLASDYQGRGLYNIAFLLNFFYLRGFHFLIALGNPKDLVLQFTSPTANLMFNGLDCSVILFTLEIRHLFLLLLIIKILIRMKLNLHISFLSIGGRKSMRKLID